MWNFTDQWRGSNPKANPPFFCFFHSPWLLLLSESLFISISLSDSLLPSSLCLSHFSLTVFWLFLFFCCPLNSPIACYGFHTHFTSVSASWDLALSPLPLYFSSISFLSFGLKARDQTWLQDEQGKQFVYNLLLLFYIVLLWDMLNLLFMQLATYSIHTLIQKHAETNTIKVTSLNPVSASFSLSTILLLFSHWFPPCLSLRTLLSLAECLDLNFQ